MPLPVPNLDDRDYAQLVAEAKALIPAHSPEWTDLSPGDPGVTLLELFAYLTDSMLYRLNRIPDKAFVQFLNLVGVTLTPPAAASVELTFSLRQAAQRPVLIPRGTRVTTSRPGPTFTTMTEAAIAPGATSATAVALNCELTPAELLGTGNGQGGQRFKVAKPPIVMDSGDGADLLVGVAVPAGGLDQRVSVIRHEGVTYRLWKQVANFGADSGDGYVFVADRAEGTITFAPSVRNVEGPHAVLLAQVPPPGQPVRAWYRSRGDGAGGNVNARTLTVLKDQITGVEVVNLKAASGGRDLETLDNAMLRGPHQVSAQERVVTARDYERVAVGASGGVSRAVALTRASLWAGAPPGQVQVLLVPRLDDTTALTAGVAELIERQSELVLERVRDALAEQQPLGISSVVGWARLKAFHVEVTVVVYRAEDRQAVTGRLNDRLRRALTPLPLEGGQGWPFGQALRVSTVYDVLLAERGVRYVESVRLVVDVVPGDVTALLADPHQPKTWFCASGAHIFRSMDDAEGWELVGIFEGERVEAIAACPGMPGMLIASARIGRTETSRIHLTRDYGETWSSPAEFSFHVEDVALGAAGGRASAWFATDNGLFRLELSRARSRRRAAGARVDPGRGRQPGETVLRGRDRLRSGQRPAGRRRGAGARGSVPVVPGRPGRDVPAAGPQGRRRAAAADPADARPAIPADRRVRDRRRARGRSEPAGAAPVPDLAGRMEARRHELGGRQLPGPGHRRRPGGGRHRQGGDLASATPPVRVWRGGRRPWIADCRSARWAGSSPCSPSRTGPARSPTGPAAACCSPAAWAGSIPPPTRAAGSTQASRRSPSVSRCRGPGCSRRGSTS